MTHPDAINEKHLITRFHLPQNIEVAVSCNLKNKQKKAGP